MESRHSAGFYITMAAKVLQQLYLSQCSLGQDFFAEDIGDLFDGDPFTGLIVCCRTTFFPVLAPPSHL